MSFNHQQTRKLAAIQREYEAQQEEIMLMVQELREKKGGDKNKQEDTG